MRALVKAEAKEGLVLRDEPVPRIGPDDILIKVAKTGICGTDLHLEMGPMGPKDHSRAHGGGP